MSHLSVVKFPELRLIAAKFLVQSMYRRLEYFSIFTQLLQLPRGLYDKQPTVHS